MTEEEGVPDVIAISIGTADGSVNIRHTRRKRGRQWESLSDTLNRVVKDARTWVQRNGTP